MIYLKTGAKNLDELEKILKEKSINDNSLLQTSEGFLKFCKAFERGIFEDKYFTHYLNMVSYFDETDIK